MFNRVFCPHISLIHSLDLRPDSSATSLQLVGLALLGASCPDQTQLQSIRSWVNWSLWLIRFPTERTLMVRLLEYAADNFWNMLGHTRWLASDRKVMQDIWWHEDHPDSFKRKAIHKASLHKLVITTSLPLQCDAQWFNKGIVSTRSFASGKLHSWTDIKSNQVKSIQTSKVLTVWRSYQKADRIATANFFCHVVAILWTILGRHNDWNWLDSIGGSWPLKADGIFGYTVNSQLGFAYHLINSLFVALTAP